MNYFLVVNINVTVLPLVNSFAVYSLIHCAVKCSYSSVCQGFVYDGADKRCTPGSSLVSTQNVVNSSRVLYSTCNTQKGFSVVANGNTSVCVWRSSELMNFTTARQLCKAKGGHLYTPRTQAKLDIMISIAKQLNKPMWIGLDDMEQLFVFVWDDDGSILNANWSKTIFAPGDPNNQKGDERCVSTLVPPKTYRLYDVPCYQLYVAFCEM